MSACVEGDRRKIKVLDVKSFPPMGRTRTRVPRRWRQLLHNCTLHRTRRVVRCDAASAHTLYPLCTPLAIEGRAPALCRGEQYKQGVFIRLERRLLSIIRERKDFTTKTFVAMIFDPKQRKRGKKREGFTLPKTHSTRPAPLSLRIWPFHTVTVGRKAGVSNCAHRRFGPPSF
jgi:hypothetical protein